MADFGTFDLGRAYAQAEDVRGAQQARSLRDLQIQAARKDLNTPKTMSPDDTIGHARILNGAMDSIIQDPSDENVKRVSAMLTASGSMPGNFDSAHILAEPLEQRVANATKAKQHFSTFLSGAAEPAKPEKASFGNPQDGINPATGKPGQFVTDNTGKQVWLTSTPIPPKPDAPRTPGYGSAQNGINPATGKPDQFIIDDFGNQKWLGSAPIPAAGAAAGKMTADERKVAYLATRLESSLTELDKLAAVDKTASAPSWGEKVAGGVPIVGNEAANLARSPNRRQAHAAQINAIDAALTIGTGAAYTREQLEGYAISYFPQIGDDQATIESKNQRFTELVAAARAAAGPAAGNIDKVLNAPEAPAAGAGTAPPAAIQYLQQHPEFAEQFKAKYGFLP